MEQKILTEEPPGQAEELKKIAEAIRKNPSLKTCLCLDGGEPKIQEPDKILWRSKTGGPSILTVKINQMPSGVDVRLKNEVGVIVGFRMPVAQ